MGAIDFLHNLGFSIAVNVQFMPQCVPVLQPSLTVHHDWLWLSASWISWGDWLNLESSPEKFSDWRFLFSCHKCCFPLENKSQKGDDGKKKLTLAEEGCGWVKGRSHLDVWKKKKKTHTHTLIIQSLNYTGFGCKNSSEHVNNQMWYNHFMHFTWCTLHIS